MPILDAAIEKQFADENLLADRSLPEDQATTLSTALFGAYKAFAAKYDGQEMPFPMPKGYNLGQGAEKEKPSEVIDQLDAQTIDPDQMFNPVYPKMQGGRKDVHEEAAGFIKRYFGVDINEKGDDQKQKAFLDVISAHGRMGLLVTLMGTRIAIANSDNPDRKMKVAIPEFCWPMYKTLLDMVGAEAVLYPNPGPDDDFNPADFEALKDVDHILVNPEENPSGALYSMSYMMGLKNWIEDNNQTRASNGQIAMAITLDCPYFGSRSANKNANVENGEFYYETSAIQEFIMNTVHTPANAVVPLTKFGATAEFGFSELIQNALAHKRNKGPLKSSVGLAGTDSELRVMAQYLEKRFDGPRLDFEESLRDKYAANRATLEAGMADVEGVSVFPGSPGLTGLLTVDLEQFFGKTVDGPLTGDYLIEDMTDIVEFLFLNYGVVTVNNGTKDGVGYLRVANAEFPEDYEKAVQQLSNGFAQISNTPEPGMHDHTNDAAGNFNDMQDGPG